jgi:hypothetical protein
MCVRLENPDGSITVLISDISLSELAQSINAAQAEAGIPVSSCIQDTLASLESPIIAEEV